MRAEQVEVVCLDIVGRLFGDSIQLGRAEARVQTVRDALGDLCLNGEDVGELAVPGFRPNVLIGVGVDQLRDNADLVAGATYAPLENVRYPKLAPDLASV